MMIILEGAPGFGKTHICFNTCDSIVINTERPSIVSKKNSDVHECVLFSELSYDLLTSVSKTIGKYINSDKKCIFVDSADAMARALFKICCGVASDVDRDFSEELGDLIKPARPSNWNIRNSYWLDLMKKIHSGKTNVVFTAQLHQKWEVGDKGLAPTDEVITKIHQHFEYDASIIVRIVSDVDETGKMFKYLKLRKLAGFNIEDMNYFNDVMKKSKRVNFNSILKLTDDSFRSEYLKRKK